MASWIASAAHSRPVVVGSRMHMDMMNAIYMNKNTNGVRKQEFIHQQRAQQRPSLKMRLRQHHVTRIYAAAGLEELVVEPISKIEGHVKLPGSKSLSNRVLLLAALAEGTTVVENILVRGFQIL